jgi:hypothetical protein
MVGKNFKKRMHKLKNIAKSNLRMFTRSDIKQLKELLGDDYIARHPIGAEEHRYIIVVSNTNTGNVESFKLEDGLWTHTETGAKYNNVNEVAKYINSS